MVCPVGWNGEGYKNISWFYNKKEFIKWLNAKNTPTCGIKLLEMRTVTDSEFAEDYISELQERRYKNEKNNSSKWQNLRFASYSIPQRL